MKVAINNLSVGLHNIDLGDFEAADIELKEPELYPNPIHIRVMIDKFDKAYRFKITVETDALFHCDRCLENYVYRFKETIEQLYEVGQGTIGIDEEVQVLAESEHEVDLNPQLQEAFLLHRPLKMLCKEDCKGLCPRCGTNLNTSRCDCLRHDIDPRLEKLKSLLN